MAGDLGRPRGSRDPAARLARPGAPKPALADEEGRGEPVPHEEILRGWRGEG